MTQHITISSDNLDSLAINFSNKKILIIGIRCIGKSWLSSAIIENINKFHLIEKTLTISPTERYDNFYSTKFDCEIKYQLDNIDTIIESLVGKNSLLVMDNCIESRNMANNCRDILGISNLTLIVTDQVHYTKDLFALIIYLLVKNIMK